MPSKVSPAATASAFLSSSSSSSHRNVEDGPRDAATEDGEDEVDNKEYTQPPTNDEDDVEDVATLIELYVTLTSVFQERWDSLTGPQQQQIIRASRSILANNAEEDEEDEEDFYDAQEYGQDEERTVLMNDDHDAHHDHHANNNDATAGLANKDDDAPPATPPRRQAPTYEEPSGAVPASDEARLEVRMEP